jgi:hypothetical protein
MRPALVLLALTACTAAPPEPAPDAGSAQGDAGTAPEAGPSLGFLQFRVLHDLVTEACLARGDCRLVFEEETARLDPWLAAQAAVSTQAVLHYDRAIPWDVFAVPPPPGQDLVEAYDAQIDADLRAYLAAFERRFAGAEQRYLAVSLLGGTRDRPAALRLPGGGERLVDEACPSFTSTLSLSFGGAPVPVEESYQRFVRYLAAKLRPTRLALLVEANLFRRFCPARWPSLVELYRRLYDRMRAELGPEVQLFATLTWAELLGYDADRCARLRFGPCDGAPPPLPPQLEAAACFPLDFAPIADLDSGGRLDVIALSFYPDGLVMSPPGLAEEIAVRPASAATTTCAVHAALPQLLDPFAPLAKLPPKPLAIAEWSARSCAIPQWWPASPEPQVVSLGASAASQSWWLDRVFRLAEERRIEFINYSFYADYAPIGLWMPRRGAMDPGIYNLLNGWACSGIFQDDLAVKREVRGHWPR